MICYVVIHLDEGDERRVVGEDDELEGEGSSGDEEEEDEMTRQERLAKEVKFMSELDMEAKVDRSHTTTSLSLPLSPSLSVRLCLHE